MRSLFLILLLANLLLCAVQFPAVRNFVTGAQAPTALPTQLNAERLRIIRDTSNRPAVPPTAPAVAPVN